MLTHFCAVTKLKSMSLVNVMRKLSVTKLGCPKWKGEPNPIVPTLVRPHSHAILSKVTQVCVHPTSRPVPSTLLNGSYD